MFATKNHVSRREALLGMGALTAAPSPREQPSSGPVVAKGRIKQSVCFWCFSSSSEKWDLTRTCQVARGLGCRSVELLGPGDWPTLRAHGLVCAIASHGMPGGFRRGWNNPRYHQELTARTRAAIDACAEAGFPSVIAFTGMKWRDADDPKSGVISLEEGADNCIRGLKPVAAYAAGRKVQVCLEHLSTRDDSHPMKGHPGYQGDNLDYVADIIRKVDSPGLRLLFDIYHVQVMHGDVIRRLEQNKDILGHIHTAGVPGRGELDDRQELNYAAIMSKLVDLGYAGYVGQEFIPTGNPLAGLRQAVRICDV